MKDKKSVKKQLNQMKVPRVFRQNMMMIFIVSMLASVLYYPFFLFNRSKQLIKLQNVKRKYLYLITPFIGLLTMFVVSTVLVVIISSKENISLEHFSAVKSVVDVMDSEKYPFYTTANQVAYIFALLCFIMPLSDLLIQFSEKMKEVKVTFPKFIANIPAIFTVTGLLYVFFEVLQLDQTIHLSGLYIFVKSIFIASIVLSHIYLANVYVLFTAIKLPIQEGEN